MLTSFNVFQIWRSTLGKAKNGSKAATLKAKVWKREILMTLTAADVCVLKIQSVPITPGGSAVIKTLFTAVIYESLWLMHTATPIVDNSAQVMGEKLTVIWAKFSTIS